jgi:2-octaprenyl-6-methoxyphenol hydroxylase
MAQPHQNIAYERFGGAGTIALLPLQNQDYSLVWSIKSAQRDEFMSLSDREFLARLQHHFGWRAGQFLKLGIRAAHPLRLLKIQQLIQPHIAFIGNAAHTLHPVAGQGFNLGLRDVASLAEILSQTPVQNLGDNDTLQRYVQQQYQEQQRVITITDSLVKTFSTDFLPLRVMRNLSLLTLDAFPPLKRLFVRQMTGFTAPPSRLTSGLPVKVQE